MKSDNELIAEFMGMRHRKYYGLEGVGEYTEVKQTPNANWQSSYWHKSWDWLMPVVEKIRVLYGRSDHHREINTAVDPIRVPIIFADIETIYKGIVEFIKWYNSVSNGDK